MSILHISQADITGGAARAAYRLHRALLEQGTKSCMKVRVKQSDDWTVTGPVSILGKASSLSRPVLGDLAMRLQKTVNVNLHTGNWLPSAWAGEINNSAAEVIHLHWVAGETLSIEDISRIRKPLVWTLHDMWAFCGAEHYTGDYRWREGYTPNNRPAYESGFDLNRWTWNRKRRHWTRPMHIITPSQWLGHCVRESVLFHDWPVSVIPNVLDTSVYQPLNRTFCRQALGLPNHGQQIILFGAMDGERDPRKGYDLLLDALARLASRVDAQNLLCVIFGQSTPQSPPPLPFATRWMGHVHDDATLVLLYNAADVMVVPSRQENLPQTATEPQACGCPVVAFDCTGFRDAVVHRETGYLARAFDTEDLAEGLRWILGDIDRRKALGQSARARALRLWAPEVVAPQYLAVYRSMTEQDSAKTA